MKKLNENFKRFSGYKPSYEKKKTLVKENAIISKLMGLIKSGQEDNIVMAFEIAKGQGIVDELADICEKRYGYFLNINRDLDTGQEEGDYVNSVVEGLVVMFNNYNNKDEIKFNNSEKDFIPVGIVDFRTVRIIIYWGSNISQISNEIFNMSELIRLSITRSKLTTVPNEIDKLKGLETLELSFNNISVIPDSVGNLTNLSGMSFSGNKITSLPNSISNLKNLTYLDISSNDFSQIPPQIFELPKLNLLSLDLYRSYGIDNIKRLNEIPSLHHEASNYSGLYARGDFSRDELSKLLPNLRILE